MGGETTKRPHTAYTPEQRALALAALDANAGCVAATAAQLEMPHTGSVEILSEAEALAAR